MSIPVHCPSCGLEFISKAYSIVNSTVTISGGGELCPRCGSVANFQSGTYDFVGTMIAAFRAPGMTRQKIEAAKQIVADASSGTIGSDVAIARLGEISSQLALLVEKAGERRIDWSLLLTVILAIYTIWTGQKSDADARDALAESRTQTEVQQKMLAESKELNAFLRESETKPALRQQAPIQTSGTKNRHERRKRAAIDRKK